MTQISGLFSAPHCTGAEGASRRAGASGYAMIDLSTREANYAEPS